MIDPFGSMQGMLGQLQQFMGNPMAYMASKKFNIPQQYMNNPNDAIQYLMNTGKLTQQQYNEFNKTAKQIQNNPTFKAWMNKM